MYCLPKAMAYPKAALKVTYIRPLGKFIDVDRAG